MGLVLSNALILEGEDLQPVQGYLEVKDGRIAKIAEGSPPRRGINLKRAIVMPPFVNAHTHLADGAWKEMYLGKTQPEVVSPQGAKSKELERASKAELMETIRSSVRDMLRTGTIAHCDFREGGAEGVKLLRETVTPPLATKILGRGKNLVEIEEVLRWADGLGLPSLESLPEGSLRKSAHAALRLRKSFSLHVDETLEAHETSIQNHGKSEVRRALELNPSFLIHATHAEAEDLLALKQREVPVVFCPRCNSLLGVGSPPIALALDLNVEFWLGTDNAMVCQPNMFEELQAAWQCIRKQNPRAGHEEAVALLQAATLKPAEELGESGALREGAEATFLILSRNDNLRHVLDIHAGLVNRGRAENLVTLYVRGKAFYFRKLKSD
jgi:cytosine/adenosine deaminase-related metal-dependent hydrolase